MSSFDQDRHERVWNALSRRVERRRRLHVGARALVVSVGALAVSVLLLRTVVAQADNPQSAQSLHSDEGRQLSALSSGDAGLRAD